jgi:nucleotide-binding universal stress UspA family protein
MPGVTKPIWPAALPAHGEQSMYQNILIATDGSELAHKAVDHGLRLAKSVGAKVTAVVVEAPFNIFAVPASRTRQISEEFAQHAAAIKRHATGVLGDVADAAKKAGLNCDTVQVEHEQPYEAIIKTAEDKGCDVIVMASHGRSGIAAVLLGSVTNKVLAHTAIPVIVVH